MKQQFYLLGAVIFLLAASYIAGGPAPAKQAQTSRNSATAAPAANQWYPVLDVIDGDTIVVRKDNQDVHVRLLGINSPEVQSPYRSEECYGKEASTEAKQVMGGSDVRLVTDPTQDLYDQYNRLLAYVYVPANSNPDGILVNDFLLQGGYAREYTFKKPYEMQARFKADEAAAQAAKRGLWGACASS